ncbi:MAG: site-2 protease family protein [Pseudomonadota bacterium]
MVEFSLTQIIAISVVPVLFAITVHEVAHGWVASKCGDQTARLSGRLTLNPIKHIDLIGTIIVPLLLLLTNSGIIFGWAKPVPIDARNMRNPRRDMAIVALAGPVSNFIMALLWALIAKLNFIFLTSLPWLTKPMVYMGEIGVLINVVLGVLNCLPVPPLDGGRVLVSLLPGRAAWYVNRFEPYMFIIIVLLMLTGIFSYIISPPIIFLSACITSIFGLPQLAI